MHPFGQCPGLLTNLIAAHSISGRRMNQNQLGSTHVLASRPNTDCARSGFNEHHTSLITTVLAIPNYRLQPTGKTVLTYDERPADQPMALAAWFYPGDSSGQEFAYPKSEAEQLSRRNKREVPSTGSEEAYPADLQQRSTRLRPRTRNRYRKAKLQPRSRSQSRQIRLWRQIPRRLRQRKPLGRVKLNCRTRPACYRSLD